MLVLLATHSIEGVTTLTRALRDAYHRAKPREHGLSLPGLIWWCTLGLFSPKRSGRPF